MASKKKKNLLTKILILNFIPESTKIYFHGFLKGSLGTNIKATTLASQPL